MPARRVKPVAHEDTTSEAEDKTGLERLVFFSDAVFAIAITLLALEIRLPAESGSLTNSELLQQLIALSPKYLAYIISFLVIGFIWAGHHRRYRYIVRYDRVLIFLNLLLLMVVAFIPFPTSVIMEQGNSIATVFYSLIIILAGIFAISLWQYAIYHNRLVSPALSRQIKLRETLRQVAIPAMFLLSIPVAYISPGYARFIWLLSFPLLRLIR